MDVHPLSIDDAAQVEALSKTVGWPHRRTDIEMLMRLGRGRVVRDGPDHGIAGVGMWWPFGSDFARLGMIIVEPGYQGRGLGRLIVEQLLADTGDRAVALLATDAGQPLYESLGFASTGSTRQHQGFYAEGDAGDGSAREGGDDELPRIIDLDRTVFGAPRDAILRELAGRIAVLEGDRGLIGYAIERPFGRGSVIGPVVAEDEEGAIQLFRHLARPGFIRVDCPGDAQRFRSCLSESGLLALPEESPTMVRGVWPTPQATARIFALAGHALG